MTLWWSAQPAPRFYPRAVTLAKNLDEGARQRLQRLASGDAIKDSFATLALPGFDLLFEASWFWRPARAAKAPSIIGDEAALKDWSMAWGGGDDLFHPALLADPTVKLAALYQGSQIIAGAALNEGAGFIGLSNLFGDKATLLSALAGPLVTYASGAEADLLLRCGFEALGPLKVWVKR